MTALSRLCADVGISVPDDWERYLEMTKLWSARTDLTAARTETELVEILFLDAAWLIEADWLSGIDSLVDVGSGVGAPTIPLLLATPSLSAILVEPRRRRVAFLRSAIGALGLAPRSAVREAKVNPDAPQVDADAPDVALSRATFDPATWQRVGAALAPEVWVLTAGQELEESDELLNTRSLSYTVPSTAAPRAIHAFRRPNTLSEDV